MQLLDLLNINPSKDLFDLNLLVYWDGVTYKSRGTFLSTIPSHDAVSISTKGAKRM